MMRIGSVKKMKITIKQKLLILFFVVLATIGASVFIRIPVGYSLILPIQHFTNMLLAVLLGPWYALAGAFSISIFRNMIGTGSIFAFPGSMIGCTFGWNLLHENEES